MPYSARGALKICLASSSRLTAMLIALHAHVLQRVVFRLNCAYQSEGTFGWVCSTKPADQASISSQGGSVTMLTRRRARPSRVTDPASGARSGVELRRLALTIRVALDHRLTFLLALDEDERPAPIGCSGSARRRISARGG
jgi:hypothetical protein